MSELDDQICRFMLHHLREDFVIWCEVVPLRLIRKWEDSSVEVHGRLEREDGDLQVVDPTKGGWLLW